MGFNFVTRTSTLSFNLKAELPLCSSAYQSDMEKCKYIVTETEKHPLTHMSSGSQTFFFVLWLQVYFPTATDNRFRRFGRSALQILRPLFGDRLKLYVQLKMLNYVILIFSHFYYICVLFHYNFIGMQEQFDFQS